MPGVSTPQKVLVVDAPISSAVICFTRSAAHEFPVHLDRADGRSRRSARGLCACFRKIVKDAVHTIANLLRANRAVFLQQKCNDHLLQKRAINNWSQFWRVYRGFADDCKAFSRTRNRVADDCTAFFGLWNRFADACIAVLPVGKWVADGCGVVWGVGKWGAERCGVGWGVGKWVAGRCGVSCGMGEGVTGGCGAVSGTGKRVGDGGGTGCGSR